MLSLLFSFETYLVDREDACFRKTAFLGISRLRRKVFQNLQNSVVRQISVSLKKAKFVTKMNVFKLQM